VLLSVKFQANTYSFERVVTLFVGYYFSSGHRVDETESSGYTATWMILLLVVV